jgi:thiosulfate/3-mercaptopyruvate sulfurtransferase
LALSRPGLITPSELADRLQSAQAPAVIDLRQRPDDGEGKIPGSVWIGLHDGFAMERPDRNLHYDLPTPGELAAAMGRLGLTPGSAVVFADDMGNRWATRALWVLRYYRHEGPVVVLDGGLPAYRASGAETSADFVMPRPAAYPEPRETDESIRATADAVRAATDGGSATICDVRTPQEFTGEVAQSGRGGHIPGAVHIPWEASLGADGAFLPDDRLRAALAPFIERDGTPITYCQGGIRASLAWFALQVLLGHPARLYAASWEEWAQDRRLPVELPP